jgi:hypothetical protein
MNAKTIRWTLLIVLVVGVIASYFFRAAAVKPITVEQMSVAVAPFVAAAVAIERFWEMAFSWYESVALSTAKLAGLSAQTTAWMRAEIKRATDELAKITDQSEPNLDALAEAEARLADAKARVEQALKSPEYVALKRTIAVLGSFVLGLFISVTARLGFLNAVGFAVPAEIDVIITGFVIGSGSAPLHSLINLIQELRNTAAGIADLTRGTAISKVSAALKDQIERPRHKTTSPADSAVVPLPSVRFEREAARILTPR